MTTLHDRTSTSHSKDRHASLWPITAVVVMAALALGYWKNREQANAATPPSAEPERTSAAVTPVAAPHVTAGSPIDAGRYIVKLAGCNDCHTGGYAMRNGDVPEAMWLTGDAVGYRGPWGTSYPSNLRLTVKDLSEDLFVQTMRQRNTRPPMPWPSLHAMSDADLRAVYQYIKSLGVSGTATPEALPPGEEPGTPYINFVPVMPAAKE